MWRLPRVLHIISRPTEPDTSNCIVSAGTDYKVTATAPSYKWHRDKMGRGGALQMLGGLIFTNAGCTFSVEVTATVRKYKQKPSPVSSLFLCDCF